MNKYYYVLLNTLSKKYPGYLFEIEMTRDHSSIWIKSKSSGLEKRKEILKNKGIMIIYGEIERMINEMRMEEIWAESRRLEKAYCENDVRVVSSVLSSYYGMWPGNKYSIAPKEVIFQDEKTTIINWTDGTKTIVKCSDDDTFSPEAGVALCYMKKFITDNDSERFHRILKSLISVSKFKNSKQENKSSEINLGSLYQSLQDIKEAFSRIGTMEEKHDINTGTPVNSGDNDSDGSAVEVES